MCETSQACLSCIERVQFSTVGHIPPAKVIFSRGHPPARPTTPSTGYGQTRLDRRLKISLADLAGFDHIPWTGCRRCRTPGLAGRGPGRPGSARDPRPLPHTDYMTEWFSPVYSSPQNSPYISSCNGARDVPGSAIGDSSSQRSLRHRFSPHHPNSKFGFLGGQHGFPHPPKRWDIPLDSKSPKLPLIWIFPKLNNLAPATLEN